MLISATNGKTTTAALAALDLRRAPGSRPCTTSPAPTWRAASPRRCCERRAGAQLGLFEVDEFWLAEVAAALAPRAIVLGEPLPRPARPLRRARDDRRALGRAASRATPGAARAQRRRPADRRPRPRARPTRSTSASRTPPPRAPRGLAHASDSTRCRNCGAAYALRARLHRASRRLRVPGLRRASARSRRSAPSDDRARRAARCELRRCDTPAGAASRAHRRSRASTTSTTRSRRRRSRPRWASALEPIAAGLAATGAVFGRGERVAVGAQRALDPARQEPRRRQRGAAPARLAGGLPRRARGAQRRDRRRPRRLLDLGRRLRDARAAHPPRHLLGHARRGAGAAAEVRRRARRSASASRASSRGRSTARSSGRRAASSTRCRPTRRCWRCASCWPAAARPRARGRRMTAEAVIWHDLECGALRGRPRRSGARSPGTRAARCSTSAPAPGASRSRSRARGTP